MGSFLANAPVLPPYLGSFSKTNPPNFPGLFRRNYRLQWQLHQKICRKTVGSFRRNTCFCRPRLLAAVAASRLVAAALPAPKAFGVNRRAVSELQGLPRLRDRGKRSACRCIGVVLRSHATDYTIIGIRFPEESWGASKLEPTNVVPMAAST